MRFLDNNAVVIHTIISQMALKPKIKRHAISMKYPQKSAKTQDESSRSCMETDMASGIIKNGCQFVKVPDLMSI